MQFPYSFFQAFSYDPDAINYFIAGSITDPVEKNAVNSFILTLKAANVYSRFRWLGLCSPTSAAAALLNFVDLGSATNVNSSTFATTGYTFNGTTQRLNLNYPMGAAFMDQNYLSTGVYCRTVPSSGTTKCFMGVNAAIGGSPYKLTNLTATTQSLQGLMGNTTNGVTVVGAYQPAGVNFFSFLASWSKVSLTDNQLFVAGVSIGSSAISGNGTPSASQSAYVGCNNNNGTAANFASFQTSGWFIADGFTPSEMTTISNGYDTYQQALGRYVYPS